VIVPSLYGFESTVDELLARDLVIFGSKLFEFATNIRSRGVRGKVFGNLRAM
jgi:hypothetical protein